MQCAFPISAHTLAISTHDLRHQATTVASHHDKCVRDSTVLPNMHLGSRWAFARPSTCMKGARSMVRFIERVVRLARNATIDLRYGGFLGGNVKTRFGERGAHDTVNSDYLVLDRIFPGRVEEDDVLCDVGCGKGRVLNYWLSLGLSNRMIGVELDPEIAASTRRRLEAHPNVDIVTGDAVSALPRDATLFYLYNPFSKPVLEEFVRALLDRGGAARVFYYHPTYPEAFDAPELSVETVELGGDAKPLLMATVRAS